MVKQTEKNGSISNLKFFIYCLVTSNKGMSETIYVSTMYFYILDVVGKDVHHANYLKGIAFIAQMVGKIVPSLVSGYFMDRFSSYKKLLVVYNLCIIIGNLIFLIPRQETIILGEGIRSIGYGTVLVMNTELTNTKSKTTADKYLTLIYLCQHIVRIVIALMLIFWLKTININIGNFRIWIGNVGPLIMIGTHLIVVVLILLAYNEEQHKINLNSEERKIKTNQKYIAEAKALLRSKAYVIFLIQIPYLLILEMVYENYLPINLHSCYGFRANDVTVYYLVNCFVQVAFLYPFKGLVKFSKQIDILLGISFGIVGMMTLQVSSPIFFCDISMLNYMYLYILPYQNILSVSLASRIAPPHLNGTSQSVLLMVTFISVSISSVCATVFVNNQIPFIIFLVVFGFGSTILVTVNRNLYS